MKGLPPHPAFYEALFQNAPTMNRQPFLTLPLALRALAMLALIIMAELINGTVRTPAITPLVGDFTARQIGTVTGCVLIGLIAWFGSP